MGAKATFKYVKISPQKVRAVINVVRGKNVQKAMDFLTYCPRKAAVIVRKAILSAVSGANIRGNVNVDNLYVSKICVGQGPTLKRWRAKARGMAGRFNKRTSHIMVELEEK